MYKRRIQSIKTDQEVEAVLYVLQMVEWCKKSKYVKLNLIMKETNFHKPIIIYTLESFLRGDITKKFKVYNGSANFGL